MLDTPERPVSPLTAEEVATAIQGNVHWIYGTDQNDAAWEEFRVRQQVLWDYAEWRGADFKDAVTRIVAPPLPSKRERACDECQSTGRCHPSCSFVRSDS